MAPPRENILDSVRLAVQLCRDWTPQDPNKVHLDLDDNASIHDQTLSDPRIFQKAHGIAFFFIDITTMFIGALGGSGIVMSKLGKGTPDEKWSAPAGFSVGGMMAGIEVGAGSNSVMMVFASKEKFEAFKTGRIQMGADIGASAGSWGRDAYAGVTFGEGGVAPVLTYSYKDGFFLGAGIDAARYSEDKLANEDLYGKGANSDTILSGEMGLDVAKKNEDMGRLYKALDVLAREKKAPVKA